jgi:membrane-associated phospholipid phosphatase
MNLFFKTISYIFQPLLIPTFGAILLMQLSIFDVVGSNYKLFAIIGTFVFTAFLPALPILIMYYKGQIKDLFISDKKDRTIPYLFAFLSYLFWIIFLSQILDFPTYFVVIDIGKLISIFLMILINLKWKISAHSAGMGGFVGALITVSFILNINPLPLIILSLIISALVIISRIYLKAHTFSQTLAGFFLGAACVVLSSFIYSIF